MLNFISWYITITILGLLAFPLTYRLFPALADRGYALSRVTGLLIWAYAFWIMASLGLAQTDTGGILLSLLVLVGLSMWALKDRRQATDDGSANTDFGLRSTFAWLKSNQATVIIIEILFLATFAFMAFVRSANPEIVGTEKPMELAFINAILRSPTFPPNDPWLSGYAISYYHFGYIMTAMLAKLTSTPGSVAFNLMLALVFAMGAIGAYGIIYNLLSLNTDRRLTTDDRPQSSVLGFSFLGPLFLLFVSNLEGFLEVLHQRGIFWTDTPLSPNFWTWLNIKDLNLPPGIPGWIPERYWWWWRASRVVQDFDLVGNFREVIDEFPAFSFLLGDLHPHVLAIPFGMLVIGFALNLFRQRQKPGMRIFDVPLHMRKIDFAFAALLLGGMAFLNTWDILPYGALIVVAYTAARVLADGFRLERIEDALAFGIPLGILAYLLYLPFFVGFASQAGGILPNLINPTRGAHLWVMFGTLFVPLFAWLIHRLKQDKVNWNIGILLTVGLTTLLWGLSWLLGLATTRIAPELALHEMTSQGFATIAEYFKAASLRRLTDIGGLLTLMALLIPTIALLTAPPKPEEIEAPETDNHHRASVFVLLLILIGGLLVIAPEFVYLRDQFGTRMNTIFKFYYQAWMLWSLAAAFGAASLLRSLRGAADWAFRVGLFAVLFIGLVFPILSFPEKTNNFNPTYGFTLDGAAHLNNGNPDDAAVIRFLQKAPLGVVAEAIGGSYTYGGRISTHTGLPTVLGWPGHEGQWRGGYELQGTRSSDIELLYNTDDWGIAQEIIQKYTIRYILVGNLERSTYRVMEDKFERFLKPVFRQGNTTIYEAP